MRVSARHRDDVVILEPDGRLTIETEAEFLRAVRVLLDAGRSRLVLNLAGVPTIDSCGLGAIAHAYTSAFRRGGDLKLLNVSARNLHLLKITKLATVFEMFDSEEQAVASFAPTVIS